MLRLDNRALARGLGWFSLGLGIGELLAPQAIRRSINAPVPPGVLKLYGLREIGSGLLILFSQRPAKMVWSRVPGDLLDITTVLAGMRGRGRLEAIGAVTLLCLVTALDVFVAANGDD